MGDGQALSIKCRESCLCDIFKIEMLQQKKMMRMRACGTVLLCPNRILSPTFNYIDHHNSSFLFAILFHSTYDGIYLLLSISSYFTSAEKNTGTASSLNLSTFVKLQCTEHDKTLSDRARFAKSFHVSQ